MRHYELQKFQKDHMQPTRVTVDDRTEPVTISPVYSPSKHQITEKQFIEYFKTLGKKCVASGDYNTKQTHTQKVQT